MNRRLQVVLRAALSVIMMGGLWLQLNTLCRSLSCASAETQLGPVTVVSGLWNIRSKRSLEVYLDWARIFLAMDAHMVLFVDPGLHSRLEALRPDRFRNRTVWIDWPISSFWTQRYRSAFERSWVNDTERAHHSPELYMVWAEKFPMLKRAIELDPFRSMCFLWTDLGAFRGINDDLRNTTDDYLHWPGAHRCREDPRVLMLRIRNLNKSEIVDLRNDNVQPEFFEQVNVGGGIFGGRRDYVLRAHDAYFEVVDHWIAKGLFIGKDQNILAAVAHTRPDIVKLVGPSRTNLWFYLEDYLQPCDSKRRKLYRS